MSIGHGHGQGITEGLESAAPGRVVHHGLQAAAQAWPAHCVAQAQALDIDCRVVALPPALLENQSQRLFQKQSLMSLQYL
jgi:hypothetical protein